MSTDQTAVEGGRRVPVLVVTLLTVLLTVVLIAFRLAGRAIRTARSADRCRRSRGGGGASEERSRPGDARRVRDHVSA